MKKILILLLLGVSILSAAQEKVLLRLNYVEGQKYAMSMSMSQVIGDDIITNDMQIDMQYDITKVTGDTYESNAKITRMAMDMRQDQLAVSYDTNKKHEELDETGQMMKTRLEPMLSATIITKGDNLGNILETRVEPSDIEGAADFADQSGSVIYPKEKVAVGDTWTKTKVDNAMTFNFIYKVKAINRNNILVDISGSISGTASGDITGTMDIDRDSGMPTLSKINMTMSIEGQKSTTDMTAKFTKI